MSFDKARKTASTLIIIGIAIALLSMFTLQSGTVEYFLGAVIGIVTLVGAITLCAVYCKCPHCGKRIFFQVLSVKRCPHCGKDVLKAPKKGGKGKGKHRQADYGESNQGPRLR